MEQATINVAIEIEGDSGAADKVATTVEGLPGFFQAVVVERCRQDIKHGGQEHDDQHEPVDWALFIQAQVNDLLCTEGEPLPDYRDRLVEIASLAAAAAQSWDRQHKKAS